MTKENIDELTNEVRSLYLQYPFPNADYQLDYGIQLLRYFSKISCSGKRSFLENAEVIEAGCGTGSTITKMAKMFPNSNFTGVDLTPASLEIANKNKEKLSVDNLELIENNILTMDLGKKFDVILNIGVLHHLSDMKLGIRQLAKHLKDDGILILWLYGTYGRFRLNLNQRLFRILLGNVTDMREKVSLAKTALSDFPVEYTECHFNAPRTDMEDDFEASLKFAFENEAWLVDQFLHVNEKTVSMDDILPLLSEADLKMDSWIGVPQHLSELTSDKTLIQCYDELSSDKKLIAMDLLLKPNYYMIAAKKS